MKKYSSPVVNIIFWALIAVFAFFVVCFLVSAPKIDNSITFYKDMKWYYQGSIEANFDDPYQFAAQVHKSNYVIETTLDKSEKNVCIAFQTNFADAEVYLDSKEIYSTYERLIYSGKKLFEYDKPTPQLNLVNLESVAPGSVIKIYVTLYHGVEDNGISNIMYGSFDDMIYYIFKEEILGIFLCVALCVCSFIVLVYHLAFRKVITLKGLKYCAVFSILSSIYAISNSSVLAFLMSTGAIDFYSMKCIAYSTMFIPLILFFCENAKHRKTEKFFQITAVIQAVLNVVVVLLAAFGIADLSQSYLIVQILSYVQCLIIMGTLIYDFIKISEKKSSDIVITVLYVILLAALTWEVFANSKNSISIIWVLGCMLFMIGILIISMRNIAQTLKLSAEVETVGRIAYTDSLTQVGNTAAFQKKLSHLEVIKINYKAIGIVQFDVNNLKVINDNLGHEMGDLLIKDGSAIIKKAFAPVGDVYRVGGDEFVAVVCGDNAKAECGAALNNFDEYIEEYNKVEDHKFLLQIAYGIEFYSSGDNDRHVTLKEIQKQADAKMYEKKRDMKTKVTKEQILKLV